jgi:hypothetical protein
MSEEKQIISNFNSKVLSSSHINFFFGAGVNGRGFPQMKGFVRSIEILTQLLGREVTNFEQDLDTLTEADKATVFKVFKDELGTFNNDVDMDHPDIKDIELLFHNINKLITESENRTLTTKQVNIYTTNYDSIVDNCLKNLGLLCNVVSSSNLDNNDKFFELIGFNYGHREYIPTYLISKIHGDLANPILPSNHKYDETLQAKRFEILFKMKSQLSRSNSILLVIGYSGNDKHLNSLLHNAISFGLSVYWFKYDNNDSLPNELKDKVFIIEQKDNNSKKNTTNICSEMVRGLWENPLEE